MLTPRLARAEDVVGLSSLMEAAIGELQRGFLTDAQIAASFAIMGIDRQLIADGTYFVVERDGQLAGCGGWSWRATLFGGDHSPGREARALDPRTEPARVRAMYTHPAHVRRGVGHAILGACERAARDAGFTRAELVATRAGVPLYAAAGYAELEPFEAETPSGVRVPLVRMGKALT